MYSADYVKDLEDQLYELRERLQDALDNTIIQQRIINKFNTEMTQYKRVNPAMFKDANLKHPPNTPFSD